MPTLTFAVPPATSKLLSAAKARGLADTASWLTDHPTSSVGEFRAFVIDRVGAPPSGASKETDLSAVRDAVRGRNELHSKQALWVDEHGLFAPWAAEEAAYVAAAGGPQQAAAGLALLRKAGELTTDITFAVKDLHLRQRPFQVDPDGATLLEGVTHARGPAFPSGHASTAYVKATVLDMLVPRRRAEHARLAEQLGQARTYAGVHFPTDLAAGAYIGAAAAAFVRARPDVELPPRGPKP